jgi:hypothetical protein
VPHVQLCDWYKYVTLTQNSPNSFSAWQPSFCCEGQASKRYYNVKRTIFRNHISCYMKRGQDLWRKPYGISPSSSLRGYMDINRCELRPPPEVAFSISIHIHCWDPTRIEVHRYYYQSWANFWWIMTVIYLFMMNTNKSQFAVKSHITYTYIIEKNLKYGYSHKCWKYPQIRNNATFLSTTDCNVTCIFSPSQFANTSSRALVNFTAFHKTWYLQKREARSPFSQP